MSESTHPRRTGAVRSMLRSGRHWPLLVVLVFSGNIAFATWVFVTASSDPSFAVEQDYYDRALHWNDEIEQRRLNDALGWTVTLDGPAVITQGTSADLVLTVLDAGGRPMSDATITALAFPVARAGASVTIIFEAVAPGRYATRLHEPRPGKWEFRITVARASDVFTARISATLTPK